MYVSVHVDPDDVLDELSDEQLEAELRQRKKKVPTEAKDELTEALEQALAFIRRGDTEEAVLLIERTLHPVFPSFDLAMQAYARARSQQ